MSKLNLRGVIVPSSYDLDYFSEYIDKGLMTPESSFRAALNKAVDTEPLNIYVNSPGGSVMAANEMAIAVKDWKKETGQAVTVTVGAMAASAASLFALSVDSEIKAHPNSKMMFHGASTVTVGGKGAHDDNAQLLEKVNADSKTQLITRFKIDPETVDAWFDEGREGWLSADEMSEAGIISEVIDGDSELLKFSNEDITRIDKGGLDIAALLPSDYEQSPQVDDVEQTSDTNTFDDESNDAEQRASSKFPGESIDFRRGYATGVSEQAAELGRHATLLSQWKSENDKLHNKNRNLEEASQKIANANHKEIDGLTTQLNETTDKLNKLLSGALTFTAGISTWDDAMRECGNDYVAAAEKYPELRREYMISKRTGMARG